MTKRWKYITIIACALTVGCDSYSQSTPRRYLEGDNAANYQRVFESTVPKDVEVAHSVVVAYSMRPGVVTTDDWEFEIVAPQSWIDAQMKRIHLREADQLNGSLIDHRKKHPIRDWYAPKPISSYNLYYLYVTSIPYVHMLVEKEARADGRHRVFISKH